MHTTRTQKTIAGLFALLLGLSSAAAKSPTGDEIPHAGERMLGEYAVYEQARPHRAFTIAPGGAWGWVEGETSSQAAADSALARCAEHTEQKCILYSVDGRIVFDRGHWVRLWGPYKPTNLAATSLEGVRVGQRFPELVFPRTDGPRRLSDERGRVAILYFLASWCGVCRRELPSLVELQHHLSIRPDVELILIPYGESLEQYRHSLDTQEHVASSLVTLAPLLREARTENPDRWEVNELTPGVPTLFVLDKNGIVLFSRRGPLGGWEAYLPFIDDARTRSHLYPE